MNYNELKNYAEAMAKAYVDATAARARAYAEAEAVAARVRAYAEAEAVAARVRAYAEAETVAYAEAEAKAAWAQAKANAAEAKAEEARAKAYAEAEAKAEEARAKVYAEAEAKAEEARAKVYAEAAHANTSETDQDSTRNVLKYLKVFPSFFSLAYYSTSSKSKSENAATIQTSNTDQPVKAIISTSFGGKTRIDVTTD